VARDVTALVELLAGRRVVALTGAGCSTESGIPDYRGQGRSPSRTPIQHDAFLRRAEVRRRYWARATVGWSRFRGALPNAAHEALAVMETSGTLVGVITQNVDRLHAAAGSREVIEVHGTIERGSCLNCGDEVPEVRSLLPIPRCPRCGAILKPGVVMFGELLPESAIDRAIDLAQRAALLLVVGSSLEVWPVAGLPEETLAHGGKLAIVNREPTRYDARAALVMHASAGETLRPLCA